MFIKLVKKENKKPFLIHVDEIVDFDTTDAGWVFITKNNGTTVLIEESLSDIEKFLDEYSLLLS